MLILNTATPIAMDRTALACAILFEQFELAKQLIWDGADVHAANQLGQSALQFAVTNLCTIDKTKIIPEYNWKMYNKYVFKSFDTAVNARDEAVLESVNAQRKGAYDSAARLSLVKELLNAGAKVNHRDHNGCSPIQCAVYTADLELVTTLIEAEADIDNQNSVGATALHDAVLCSKEAMVHLLLSRGASVNVRTVEGDTPLHWAAMLTNKNSHAHVLEELLKYPVDVNSEDNKAGRHFVYVSRDVVLSRRHRNDELDARASGQNRGEDEQASAG